MADQQAIQGWITIGMTVMGGIITFGVGLLMFYLKIILKQFKELICNNTEAMTKLSTTVDNVNATLAKHEVRIGNVETIHKIRGCSDYKHEDN
jgi:hypothetical protein